MNKTLFCVACGKMGTISRQLCRACYSKQYRQTPIGSENMKAYNMSDKAKQSRAIWKAKQPKQPIKEKVVKYCGCGNVAIAKNLCRGCYQRERYIKTPYKYTGPRKLNPKKFNFDVVFALVQTGYNISDAIDKAGYERGAFYNSITPLQKNLLHAAKSIGILDDDYE